MSTARSVLQQFEHERRRYLVLSVSNADVIKRHICCDCISLNEAELVAESQLIHTLYYFCNHARVNLYRDFLLATL